MAGAGERRIRDPRGRLKAYRPLAGPARREALRRGLAAYERGAFYLAHEELEPAWMGAVDPGERELLAGLIKLSAAFVHAARGNAAGVLVNLRGARARLAAEDAAGAALRLGLDTTALPAAIDELLAGLERAPAAPPDRAPGRPPDPPHEVAGPPGRALRPPLALAAPSLDPGLRPGAADAGAGAPGTPGSGPCG